METSDKETEERCERCGLIIIPGQRICPRCFTDSTCED